MKPSFQAAAIATFVALGAQYSIVDADGHAVGSLVTDAPPTATLRVIGVANAARPATAPRRDQRSDRAFNPNFTKALSAEQTSRAWQAEIDRLMPQPVTGGG